MPDLSEEDRARVDDMLARADLILGWVAGFAEVDFASDLKTRDAVALNLQVIGETARRLGDRVKASSPEIPWAAIVALRNRIAHGYVTVDHRMVWAIVRDDLPGLRAALTSLARP
jgi:uncharacterized protein with HEPN domain